jgi:hypothetical protein
MSDESSAAPTATAARLITIYQLMVVVLLWNSAYKGARVLNTLYALELGASPLHIGLLPPRRFRCCSRFMRAARRPMGRVFR